MSIPLELTPANLLGRGFLRVCLPTNPRLEVTFHSTRWLSVVGFLKLLKSMQLFSMMWEKQLSTVSFGAENMLCHGGDVGPPVAPFQFRALSGDELTILRQGFISSNNELRTPDEATRSRPA